MGFAKSSTHPTNLTDIAIPGDRLYVTKSTTGTRHCEERGRRSNPFCALRTLWIASPSLSSGARLRDPLARNDDERGYLAGV
jgi:hypothetical protein